MVRIPVDGLAIPGNGFQTHLSVVWNDELWGYIQDTRTAIGEWPPKLESVRKRLTGFDVEAGTFRQHMQFQADQRHRFSLAYPAH